MTSLNWNKDRLQCDWNEALYKEIAMASGSKQAVRDMNFGRFGMHHTPQKMITMHFADKACAVASITKKGLHIYGIATKEEHKRSGRGGAWLCAMENLARQRGAAMAYTKTVDGKDFYLHRKYSIVGVDGREFLMQKRL